MTAVHVSAIVVAALACACDITTRRIPNVLTFGAAGAALLYHAAVGGWYGLGLSLAGWCVGAALFFLPFSLGGRGAGDVKLLAALGAWVGTIDVLWLAAFSGIAGFALALVVAVTHGYLRRALQNVWLLLCHWRIVGLRAMPGLTVEDSRAPKLAYAVPILAGTLAVTWLR
jgi:prepilin peptidase CpaA